MSKITDFFAKQPYKYATLRMLHTEWFDIKKPEMIRELNTITGMEFNEDKTKCRITRKFNRVIYDVNRTNKGTSWSQC